MAYYKTRVLAAAIFSSLLLSACSTLHTPARQVPQVPYSALLQAADAQVPTLAEIFSLSAAQQNEFLAFFNAPEQQAIAGHERIYRFLENKLTDFDYQGQNYTASQAYRLNSGNCISLAVLTKALADLAGVETKFQSIVSAPVFSINNDFMLSSDHVRTILFDPQFVPEKGKYYLSKPAIIIDYMPTTVKMTGPRISQQTFIAMFYRNLAADAVLAEQYDQALALLRTALQYAPEYGAIINLAAIVHRRMDDVNVAEQFYRYGLDIAERKATLLSNYAVLKQAEGDTEAAQQLYQSLAALDERDPYLWYLMAKTALQNNQFPVAISYFEKAVAQAPYIHQLHFELAVAYFRDNQYSSARQALTKAAELSPAHGQQQNYHAKLEALTLHQ